MATVKKVSAIKNTPKHLLGIQNLSIIEAKNILNEAKTFIKLNRSSSKKLDENSAQFILQGVLDFYHKKNTWYNIVKGL